MLFFIFLKKSIILQFCHLSNRNENSATHSDTFLSSFMGKKSKLIIKKKYSNKNIKS